jgi:hypothetical protein
MENILFEEILEPGRKRITEREKLEPAKVQSVRKNYYRLSLYNETGQLCIYCLFLLLSSLLLFIA